MAIWPGNTGGVGDGEPSATSRAVLRALTVSLASVTVPDAVTRSSVIVTVWASASARWAEKIESPPMLVHGAEVQNRSAVAYQSPLYGYEPSSNATVSMQIG